MKNANFFLGIMMAIIGLVMLLAAESIVKILVIVLGVSALLDGIFIFTSILPLCDTRYFKIECIVRAAISIVVGLLCIILPLSLAQFVWQTFVYIFAIYAVISIVLQVAAIVQLNSVGVPIKRHVVEIASTIVLAIILFMLPSSFGFTLIRIGGVILLLAGAIMAFIAWKNRDIVIDDAVVSDDE